MAQARRSSAEQSNPSDAHGPSEVQPTAQAPTAPSTPSPRPRKQAPKGPDAATRKPRGAAASESRSAKAEVASAFSHGTRKARSVAGAGTLSPAIASSQAPILSPGVTGATSGDLPALTPDAWRLLATPAARFHAWIATHGSEDAACDALCSFLVERTASLLKFVQEHGFTYSYVTNWLHDARAPSRADKYARAREDRAHVFAEQVVEISDEAEVTRRIDPETGAVEEVVFDATAIQRNRLRVDARKWLASKMAPRTYGDKLAVGGDPDAPAIQTAVQHVISFGGGQGAPLPLAEVVDAGRLPSPDSEGDQA